MSDLGDWCCEAGMGRSNVLEIRSSSLRARSFCAGLRGDDEGEIDGLGERSGLNVRGRSWLLRTNKPHGQRDRYDCHYQSSASTKSHK